MVLSASDLEEIEQVAAAAYTPTEVAFALGFNPKDFRELVMDVNSDAAAAYFKGFYSSEIAVRKSILMLARNGSSPAQTMANKLFDEARRNLIKTGFTIADES